MQIHARIAGGIVAELIVIEADAPPIEERYHPDIVAACVEVPAEIEVAEGWSWDGSAFAPPAPAVHVVPNQITRRQLLLALAGCGLITGEEALAAATIGSVPASIDAVFAGLPAAEALAARITWATMSVAERGHPLIAALIDGELATAAEVDALFVSAAAL